VECAHSCGNLKNGSPKDTGLIFLVKNTARERWSFPDGLL